jgi:RHS repeat-associated protein
MITPPRTGCIALSRAIAERLFPAAFRFLAAIIVATCVTPPAVAETIAATATPGANYMARWRIAGYPQWGNHATCVAACNSNAFGLAFTGCNPYNPLHTGTCWYKNSNCGPWGCLTARRDVCLNGGVSYQGICVNVVTYSCPATGGWTLSGSTCTRPDCNPGETRDPVTGICIPPQPTCDPGYSYENGSCRIQCSAAAGEVRDETTNTCVKPEAEKQQGTLACEVARFNPIHIGLGTKHESLTVYEGSGVLPVVYRLSYTSRLANDAYRPTGGTHGLLWEANLGRRLSLAGGATAANPSTLLARRADGKGLVYSLSAAAYAADADINETLSRQTDGSGATTGYTLKNAADQTETYDPSGKLLSIADANGNSQTFAYDGTGRLISAADPFGRTMSFTHDTEGRVLTLTQPDGGVVLFSYSGNVLSGIQWPDGTSRSFHYEDGRYPDALTGITDELGVRYATWTYDGEGRAISSEHAGGVDHGTVSYGAGQSTVTDALGASRTTTLTTVLGVVRGTGSDQPAGAGCGPASSVQSYDARGNVASRTDFNGVTTSYTHDARNLETQRIEAVGTPLARTTTTEWHPSYRLPTRVAEPLRRITFSYDAQGNLLSRSVNATSDADGSQGFAANLTSTARTWTWTYDSRGRVLTEDGPLPVADTTTYAYAPDDAPDLNARGRLAAITNALGQVTAVEWDANGRLAAIIDANGTRTDLVRDPRGRVISRTTGGETTSYAYDAVGQLTTVTRPDGSATHYDYDPAHRLESVTDAQGNRIDITRDLAGNPTTVALSDAQGTTLGTQTYAWDQLGRLASQTGAAGQLAQYAMDAMGNPLADTDPLGRVTLYGVDAFGRRTDHIDADGGSTGFVYDALDRMVSVTDPRNLVTAYSYDGLGNQTALVSPDTGTTIFTHDIAGRETSRTDAKGQVTSTTYDLLDRPTLVTHADGNQTHSLWDAGTGALGRLAQLSRQDASASVLDAIDFAWDAQGRLTGQVNTIGSHTASVGYAYSNGQLASLTLPSGRVLNYTRDANGRVNGITLTETTGSRSLVSNASYRPFGGLTGFVNGANQALTRQYDGDGRTTAYSLGASVWSIELDAASRITGQTEQPSLRSGSYAYDTLDRLTGALLPNASYGYAWDATGNRSERSSGGDAVAYVTEATSNRLASIGGSHPKAYNYDANGSRTSDGSSTFAYDARGRLSSVTNAGGTTSYQVNALGQRVKKTKGSSTTYFHYDQQGHLIAESSGSGFREYVWLGDTPIAVLDGAQGNTTVSWLFADHLDTPRIATDDAGTVIWRLDPLSEPFGEAIPEQDPDGNGTAFVLNLRFPGQVFDQETGLHYNTFRDYDPQTGRYVQSDPIGLAGGINTYLYADGAPSSRADPLGLFTVYGKEMADGSYRFTVKFCNRVCETGNTFGRSGFKLLDRIAGATKQFSLGAGINQVEGYLNRMRCAKFDDELEALFGDLGYRSGMFGGDQLSESQLAEFFGLAATRLPKDVAEMYEFETLIDRAKANAPPHPRRLIK